MLIATFNVLIDKLVSCLDHRLTAYTHLTNLFHVLSMPDNMSISELTSRAEALAAAYPTDLTMSLEGGGHSNSLPRGPDPP